MRKIDEVTVRLKDGSSQQMLVTNLLTYLQAAFHGSEEFQNLIMDSMKKHSCAANQPWKLVYYSGEVTSGNVLSADQSRKLWMVYASFLELGPFVLSKEESWITLFAKRSSEVFNIDAGVSQVTTALLDCSVQTAGVKLKGNSGKSVRLFFGVGGFAPRWGCPQDDLVIERGLWDKILPLLHKPDEQQVSLEEGEELLTCSTFCEKDIVFATDESLTGTLERLKHNSTAMSKNGFALWQQATGLVYNPKALIFDERMDGIVFPLRQMLHDWMHAFLVKGVFQTCMFLMLTSLERLFNKDVYSVLHNYMDAWQLPANRHENLKFMFTSKRKTANKQANTFKCTASVGLTLYPIFAFFLQAVVIPAGCCLEECAAFVLLADVLDCIQAVPHGCITSALLKQSIHEFLQACLDCGRATCTPNFTG